MEEGKKEESRRDLYKQEAEIRSVRSVGHEKAERMENRDEE